MSELFRKLMNINTNFVAEGEVLDKIFTPEELKFMNTSISDPPEFYPYPAEKKDV